jgi:anti-sigma regulatory factor (Ser/Thr protein kinase)
MRFMVTIRLNGWGLPALKHSAMLVMAELVANAVTATPDGQVSVRAVRNESSVLISVWDSSPERPQPQPFIEPTLETVDLSPEHFDDNGGKGLWLVMALPDAVGVQETSNPPGKWVWARLDI